MNPDHDPASKNNRRIRLYFLIAISASVLMCLFWALDDSLVRILFGVSAYFFFLTFYHQYLQREKKSEADPDYYRTRRKKSAQSKNAFKQNTTTTNNPKGLAAAAVFVFFVFFIIVAVAIFLSSSEDDLEDYAFQTAEQFRYNGEYDSAKLYYRQVLAEDPENKSALLGYGYSLFAQDDLDSALAYYDRVLALDGDDIEGRYNKGLVRYYQQRYDESRKEAQHVLTIDPNYTQAILLTGDDYYAQNRYDSAIYWYEKGYDNGERSPILCHIMGYIYDTQGKRDKAIALYQESISYDSANIEVYKRLGELFPGAEGDIYRSLAVKYSQE